MMRKTIVTAAMTLAMLTGAGAATAAVKLLPGPTPVVGWTATTEDTMRTYYRECGPIVISEAGMDGSPAYRAWIGKLQRQGWHGRPGDRMEALYPRGC